MVLEPETFAPAGKINPLFVCAALSNKPSLVLSILILILKLSISLEVVLCNSTQKRGSVVELKVQKILAGPQLIIFDLDGVIVDTAKYHYLAWKKLANQLGFEFTEEQKSLSRQKLQADPQTLIVLFMGRLSFHAKAHPLAMYQALQKAATAVAASGKKIVLVECGWHANEFIEKAYRDAALQACPDVEVITLDGRKAEDRETAWAGADVFCSLSDNIQETFGIVPIEAMAAGLPVLVSDWDGYKDTVRHGVDGRVCRLRRNGRRRVATAH